MGKLVKVMDEFISLNQSTILRGCLLVNGVVVVNELVELYNLRDIVSYLSWILKRLVNYLVGPS